MHSKKESATQTQKITGYDKEELFAHAYIKHIGNGAAAAREVYNLESDNSAYVQASRMLRKAKVQEIINEHMEEQRRQHKIFIEQGPYRLVVIAEQLLKRVQSNDVPFNDFMKAAEMLCRLSGFELSEAVTIARVRAEAAGPIPEQRAPAANNQSNRKVVFMLSPPPMPQGGVPTPALEAQWREMGWTPDWKPEISSQS